MNVLFILGIILIFLLSCRQMFIIIKNKILLNKIELNEQKLHFKNIELRKLNQKILHDAQIDFLTQLSNRRYIDEAFKTLCPNEGTSATLGILLIDVDHFKQINDVHGHQVGDKVLQEVAKQITKAIRGNDIAGRFGGDEFIILLPGAGIEVLSSIGNRIQQLISKDNQLTDLNVTLCIGGSSWNVTQEDYDIDVLLKRADKALYQAKENGRNQCKVYTTHDIEVDMA